MADTIRYIQGEMEEASGNLSNVGGRAQELIDKLTSLINGLDSSVADVRMFDSTVGEELDKKINELNKLSEKSRRLSSRLSKVISLMAATETAISHLVSGEGESQNPNDVKDNSPTGQEYHWENMPTDTKEEYDRMIRERHDHAYDSECKELYDKYVGEIRIGNDLAGGGYYDPTTKEINYDWEKDGQNIRGQGYTYYHEMGHMLDDYTKANGDSSSSEAFSKALESDFQEYVRRTMEEHDCSRDEAYEIISDWLNVDADLKNGLSDICGGLTGNACEGPWGHSDSYWEGRKEHGIPDMVNNEAFAHFFESSMRTDSTKIDYIREIFPNAYNEFKNIVRNAL